eukprot:symbB.v1.2.002506.t1/scaffold132.1/size310437/17
MAKGKKVYKPKEDEKSRQTKDEAEGRSGQNSEMILRMSSFGLDTEKIAQICNIEAAEVVKILEATEDSQSSHQTDGEQGLTSLVKRLMTDPKGLCCAISHQLMEDPVVAGDGFTYERSMVEALFKHNGCSAAPESEGEV